ncbi:MAG: hypothetical protein LBG57_05090 [Treponema sp.]|jgi:hypothetical protein|nr:hypothetical protein [Treponema sp.]
MDLNPVFIIYHAGDFLPGMIVVGFNFLYDEILNVFQFSLAPPANVKQIIVHVAVFYSC